MLFSSPLHSGVLIKRYKRFLADVLLDNGEIITIHCANTGAMTGCATPGDRVWFSTSTNPKRKLPFSWELTQTINNEWICVNTQRANQIVKEALEHNQITELSHYEAVRAEVKYGTENSRIDFLLSKNGAPDCYMEVKSVTLFDPITKQGYFPDAVTLRGQKHLRELTSMAQNGFHAVLFFIVLHSGIDRFSPVTFIDPTYTELLRFAIKGGVDVLCYKTMIDKQKIVLDAPIPFDMD
ncbi:DNA/RNA nuclease SfsA [Orbaceae bacterium ac157xtp]